MTEDSGGPAVILRHGVAPDCDGQTAATVAFTAGTIGVVTEKNPLARVDAERPPEVSSTRHHDTMRVTGYGQGHPLRAP
jgi:hypothetical protein